MSTSILKDWTAKRAGGRITILHDAGKVPHVDKITCRDGRVVATAADGQEFELSLDPASVATPTLSREDIAARVNKIVVEHLGQDLEKVVETAKLADDLGADSLDQVELVMAGEEEFGVEFSDEEMVSAVTVGDVINMIAKKMGA